MLDPLAPSTTQGTIQVLTQDAARAGPRNP